MLLTRLEEAVNEKPEGEPASGAAAPDAEELRRHAAALARSIGWLPNVRKSQHFARRWRGLAEQLGSLLRTVHLRHKLETASEDFRWLHDNVTLVATELQNTGDELRAVRRIPHVRITRGEVLPRVAAVAEGLTAATSFKFSASAVTSYVEGFQECTTLDMGELWMLASVIKLVLLEELAVRASQLLRDPEGSYGVGVCIRSLREATQAPWKQVIEPLIKFDDVLRQDPVGAYPRMDFESRSFYRNELANIAAHSDFSEYEVALAVLRLANEAQEGFYADSREALRRSHIGYYLVAEGVAVLHERVGFHFPLGQRLRFFLKQHPNEFYLSGVAVLTMAIMSGLVVLLTDRHSSLGMVLFTMLALLLPCSQSAVQLVNYWITSLLNAQILPKLDFADGLPDDCVTMVAVPTLLLNEEQVHRLVNDLEVRFLANQDRNLHFALLTDLADSPAPPCEEDPLLNLCSTLINGLNAKYRHQGAGRFYLFHRHRIYNPRERVWMGWERKRGKLLDLNRFLRRQYDSFPVKVGDLSILPHVRFVITLDADTELPRGAAHRMVGALAHPLNQAIVDPEINVVVAGYGILQPRVGVSVQSAARSRLAKIYSGQTGLDTYTRASSDVYQDLYGEGTFAGKGIYEVDVLHRVLDGRFPCNALLSHDLIEGAYARAGLASDIEIIEGYPSHYSAYNRRKHRWLRGDWQIVEWLTSHVPGEQGKRVPNPISLLSQWKILDNLRRSLVEPATFMLFLLGWLVLPGSERYWTLAIVAILFAPAWCRALFGLVRAAFARRMRDAREALSGLFDANINVLLMLTFLAHQMLLSLDAMVRVLVRRKVTRLRLLQWETAAEAELGVQPRTPLDTYLDLTPVLALSVGILVWVTNHGAFWVALPILLLWAFSWAVSAWLNLPLRAPRNQISERDQVLLRGFGLRTWRYFAEFSTAEHNWLIPDNVQEDERRIAARVSPTNLGLLLNARQVACRLGYLTVPELRHLTKQTLATISKLQRFRGHLLNWYDTRTLEPLPHPFVSSVDSGNLIASLWTLKQGCLEQLRQPLLPAALADGVLDHLQILAECRTLSRRAFSKARQAISANNWLQWVLDRPENAYAEIHVNGRASKGTEEARWWAVEADKRLKSLCDMVRFYTPWLLPEFRSLRDSGVIPKQEVVVLDQLPDFIDDLAVCLSAPAIHPLSEEQESLRRRLLEKLPRARCASVTLIEDLRRIALDADELAEAMDFQFLLSIQRELLSIGFNLDAQQLESACYDLLASEARMAVFIAIAKDEIPQETWFSLGRIHVLDRGRPILRSWTGTMFEYLMPSIWMHAYPGTLLERSRRSAVRAQRAYTARKGIPWGISESAHARKDEAGNYQYFAFGIPQLALRKDDTKTLVISPYSTFLALPVDPEAALQNLRAMKHLGWVGAHGFYEAGDFSSSSRWVRRCELVRSWMAHHQGMSLLSLANFLCDGIVQRWFHLEPRVQATELLLQEKPIADIRPPLEKYGAAA